MIGNDFHHSPTEIENIKNAIYDPNYLNSLEKRVSDENKSIN